ncbi:MAG: hypothetical protein COX34_01715 [Candidatus Nealsonbacteria bacterium CG23_combo_of_CG06-09_8_20_14_all_36_12]|uniref:ATPase AAA-type core domain-containing protein n=1 Tax=Candidatus Nealsonbacteria bacterium CG23_combo_of_CG06-09_8_20_14_all_36_12 TaxID=1974718 RepID=A0A2G9Z1R1_9BACT|nr:MAG: hypothetical protein COX34_01715 [Candidatus Nealsonbacteria bacterium CG23_combo_of_CG06-09_8_20_14_all_36_12]
MTNPANKNNQNLRDTRLNDPRGSLWRKWDLHIHTPETKKNDQYKTATGDVWDLFCKKLEESDVVAFGITDYFSVNNYFTFIDKFKVKYSNSLKVFFPNVEICTSDVVNKAAEEVNLHLIFNPDIPNLKTKLGEFLSNLKTNGTNSSNRNIKASELSTKEDFEKATTTRKFIEEAIKDTFGSKIDVTDYLIIIAASNNDGIRTATEKVGGKVRGKQRKVVITDEIDKFSHGFFGNSNNIDHFSNRKRLDNGEEITPKPVISGSDSHSFDDIDNFLGKKVVNAKGETEKEITWVKADLSYEGLKQIIYEPISGERVFVGVVPPGEKSPDRVIHKITFTNTSDFPKEILFNDNLCSIIGSRSSGKSALLAYLAYSVDPDYTKRIKPDGPAANISWDDVTFQVAVEWGNALNQQGKVVYIPQNHLAELSSRPEDITAMIKPVLFEKHSEIRQIYERLQIDVRDTYNKIVTDAVTKWFIAKEEVRSLEAEIKEQGDKTAIDKVIADFEKKIDELKKIASLSDKDVKAYKTLSQDIHSKKVRLAKIEEELGEIQGFVYRDSENEKDKVISIEARVSFVPAIESLPPVLQKQIIQDISQWSTTVSSLVQKKILSYKSELDKEKSRIQSEIKTLHDTNKDLIEKCKKNEQLQDFIDKLDKQKERKSAIEKLSQEIIDKNTGLRDLSEQIKKSISDRALALENLKTKFTALKQTDSKISFGIEIQFNPQKFEVLSARFNRKESSDFIDRDKDLLKLDSIRSDPHKFLEAMFAKKQKVLIDENFQLCAKDTLSFVEEIRFNATMENDTIGGFKNSSMTEGKQALFALTLLLNKESDTWPLLIDQPEDDLDSRSMYFSIVPYLKEQKKRRQVIMISHNANLVVGADSEQIIVANQHGDDRKNRNNQKFDYLSGSLEYTKERDKTQEIVLLSCGIREHACDILDGGEAAFEKRKDKYNI